MTVFILKRLLDVFASVRLMMATFGVTLSVTHDWMFAFFTTACIEGAFVLSLLAIKFDAVAPIISLVALLLSAFLQGYEIRSLNGVLTKQETDMLFAIIQYAPAVILFFSWLEQVSSVGGVEEWTEAIKKRIPFLDEGEKVLPKKGRGSKSVA